MNEALQLPALQPVMPELILVIGAMALLMLGVFRGDRSTGAISGFAVLLIIVAGVLIALQPEGKVVAFGGSFVSDGFARFLKLLALIGSAATIIMSIEFLSAPGRQRFEFPILILLSTTGMMMLISAGDLIALYLGLELMSLALYVIAAIDRDNVRSTEAGLKYFVLGALSSGMLLYGCVADLRLHRHGRASPASPRRVSAGGLGLVFGLVFLFAGLCFKVSAVPFHMWTPDVYEGAPTPVTAFFASAPKIAAMAVFVRAAITAFPEHRRPVAADHRLRRRSPRWCSAPSRRSARRNIKRLMAYSSIGNMGFALIGLAAGTGEGVQGGPDLHGDLSCHDARHLRLHPGDAPRGRVGRDDRRSRRARAHQAGDGVLPGDAHVLARRHPAARRLLRQVLRLPRGHEGRALHARGHRRAGQRGGRLLLSAHRQDRCISTSRRRGSSRCAAS